MLTRPTNLIFPLGYKVGLVKLIKKNSSGYNNFFKTFILSLILIFAFFSLPSTFDFFSQTDKDSNTPRLSANAIEQLFKNTKNDLKEVRKTKLVNIDNSIDHLPKKIVNIKNVE